jgi:hypothetical protein
MKLQIIYFVAIFIAVGCNQREKDLKAIDTKSNKFLNPSDPIEHLYSAINSNDSAGAAATLENSSSHNIASNAYPFWRYNKLNAYYILKIIQTQLDTLSLEKANIVVAVTTRTEKEILNIDTIQYRTCRINGSWKIVNSFACRPRIIISKTDTSKEGL